MVDIMTALGPWFSAAALVVVAMIERGSRRRAKEEDERAEVRKRESRLSMSLMDATAELTDVIAIAVTGGHTNGNVEAARLKVKAARSDYKKFLEEVTSGQVGA